MKWLKKVLVVSIVDLIRCMDVKEKCSRRWLLEWEGQSFLKRFGHREDRYMRIQKNICMAEVIGTRMRCKPNKRWTEGVKELVKQRGLSFKDNERRAEDRNSCKEIVNGGARNRVVSRGAVGITGGISSPIARIMEGITWGKES